jgi:Family of unknown function (DUF6152)
MKTQLAALSLILTLLMTPIAGFAHHSDAAYATTSIVVKNATITKFSWMNPHGLLAFDVKDEKGQVVHWVAEFGSPSAMSLIGWNRNIVTIGEEADIEMFPSKNGEPIGRLAKISYKDGRVLNYRVGRQGQ